MDDGATGVGTDADRLAGTPQADEFSVLISGLLLAGTNDYGSDEALATAIKNVTKASKQQAFAEALGVFVQKKDAEIEKMCNFHYQEFVQSVDQLLKVRSDTVNLKTKIVDLNKELQESAKRVASKASLSDPGEA
jgi:methylthioribose-1-phosphate isomerase